MGVTKGDLQVGIYVDVILENCTITFFYVFNERSAPAYT